MKPIEDLTKEERYSLYKQALKLLKSGETISGLDNGYFGMGLCLLLPCLYWNLTSYLDYRPDTNEDWSFGSVTRWFPEIKGWVLKSDTFEDDDLKEQRILFLTNLINDTNK